MMVFSQSSIPVEQGYTELYMGELVTILFMAVQPMPQTMCFLQDTQVQVFLPLCVQFSHQVLIKPHLEEVRMGF